MRARDEQVQARALALLERSRRARGDEPTPPPETGGAEDADTEHEAVPVAARALDTPRLVEMPSGLRGAVLRPSWPALAGLVLVLVLVGGIFATRVLLARSAAEPQLVPAAHVSTSAALVTAGAAPSGAVVPAGPTTTSSQVVVDVVGAVRRPGVLRLPAGARVVDALAAAGGPVSDADLAGTNRARVLVDGEQLRVLHRGETPPPSASAPVSAPGTATPGAGPQQPVDLNTADAAALDALPGIGPAIAGRIVEWRAAHGRFTSIDELGEVSGIGDKLLERLRPLVRV